MQSVSDLHDCLSDIFSEFENPIKAELFRLYGFYLTFAGRAKNKKDFHLRAKDALTIAIELFESENLPEKAAEAKIIMAFAYWNNGEVENAETHLDMAELEFVGNKLHPVFLQIQVNRLMILSWSGKFEEARILSDSIQNKIGFCSDSKVKLIHHFESAILFHHSLKYDKAIYHFLEAEKIAKETNNQHLSGLNYNNFSLLYLDQKNFHKAHFYSKLSLEILEKISHTGWIPHVLDSRANIFLAEEKFKAALSFIEKALEYFYKSDDYKGLAAALWSKCLILLRQSKTEEAFIVFGELESIAAENIGEIAVRRYAKLLSNEIYPLRGTNYEQEVPEFKKFLVTRALHAANGKKTEAARILGFVKHQNLSEILKKQFPHLYAEIGYSERESRSDKNREKSPKSIVKTQKSEVREEKTQSRKLSVSKIDLGNRMVSFSWNFEAEIYSTFYFNETVMRSFGINEGAVVVVVPSAEIVPDDQIIALDGEQFVFGKVRHDSFSNVFFLEWENETVFLTAENIVGIPAAYQSISKIKAEIIEFMKL
ncbi:MAG TPA: tetratricopeptide repeat protein, partial [Pyrinomonadaceae bacterium]|nr:tetratricopeptide repeat protein [Pyrinomonadaceae bacterium]